MPDGAFPVPGDDWLSRQPLRLVPDSPRVQYLDARRALGAILACGPRRRAGLPAYLVDTYSGQEAGAAADALRPALPPDTPALVPFAAHPGWRLRVTNRDGSPTGRKAFMTVRQVIVAVALDLAGLDSAEVAEQLLGLHRDERYRDALATKRIRKSAREARDAGRIVLAGFGTWPWTHATGGRLPRGWLDEPRFVDPLEAWRKRSTPNSRPSSRAAAPHECHAGLNGVEYKKSPHSHIVPASRTPIGIDVSDPTSLMAISSPWAQARR
jgi:hypothetical protein